MTRTEMLSDLQRFEVLFDNAIIVTRIIVDPAGHELRRIPRVYLQPRGKEKTP